METEIIEKICAIRAKFDTLIKKHDKDNSFEDSVQAAFEDYSIPSEEKIREEYENKAAKERLLRIGIVGAVKAGKSSLLNSVFFGGKDILPKAATPMTAALTEITFGDEYSVKVDFFTDEDIKELKKKSDEYERRLEELKNKKFEEALKIWTDKAVKAAKSTLQKVAENIRENFSDIYPDSEEKARLERNAERSAEIQLKNDKRLSGSYDQYKKIKENEQYRKKGSETFTVSSADEIAGSLEEYVGADGKYMPFTSKVSITLPFEELRGISVVDTPGFNDPVPSRDARARQALHECDVIFILSKSTPFLTSADMEVMGKITKTNRIRDIFVVASQTDSTIIGPDFKQAEGNIDIAIDSLKSVLSKSLERNIKDNNQAGVFDEIINTPEDYLLLASGQCEAMARTFEDRKKWDSGKLTSWKNLQRRYPDYFSDSDENTSIESLRKLGNVEVIREKIDKVKERKEEIFKRQREEFGKKYKDAIENAKRTVLKDLAARKGEIEQKDINQIESEIASMRKMYDTLAPEFDFCFTNIVDDWANEMRKGYAKALSSNIGEVKEHLKGAAGEIVREWTTGMWWWKKEHQETITTINLTTVINEIADYIDGYNIALPIYVEEELSRLKKMVSKNIQQIMLDNKVSIIGTLNGVRNRISIIMSKIIIHDNVNYTGPGFSYNSGESYRLEGKDADTCFDKANDFIRVLNAKFRSMLSKTVENVCSACRNCDFSKLVLESYMQNMEQKKRELEKPKKALESINAIIKEVENIRWQ